MVRTVFRRLRGRLLTAEAGRTADYSTGSISSGSGSFFCATGRIKGTGWTGDPTHSFRLPGTCFTYASG